MISMVAGHIASDSASLHAMFLALQAITTVAEGTEVKMVELGAMVATTTGTMRMEETRTGGTTAGTAAQLKAIMATAAATVNSQYMLFSEHHLATMIVTQSV